MRRNAHNGCGIRSLRCHNMRLNRLHRQSIVLHIDPDKIKQRAQRVGNGGIVKRDPHAEAHVTALELLAELHRISHT